MPVTSVTLSWRGLLFRESARALRGYGFTTPELKMVTVVSLEKSVYM